jgi:hypothetical protein
MLKLLSGIIPCLFISWLYMGDVKTMSEHRGVLTIEYIPQLSVTL